MNRSGGAARAVLLVVVLVLAGLPGFGGTAAADSNDGTAGAGASTGAKDGERRSDARAALDAVRRAASDGARLQGIDQGTHAGRDLTHLLVELWRLRPLLDDRDRAEADRYFQRPTDGGDPLVNYTTAEAPPVETARFRVHYVETTRDAASMTYVNEVAAVMEEVWDHQVDALGWAVPTSDGVLGGNGKVDVYLADVGNLGAFGYAAPDGRQATGCQIDRCTGIHGYVVLDNDYAEFRGAPGDNLRVTAAHEFNHVVHFTESFTNDFWMFEATGVWSEVEAYPTIDGRTQYLPEFSGRPDLPFTAGGAGDQNDPGFLRAYGLYVFNLWLSDQYGPRVVVDAWRATLDHDAHSLAGYAQVLEQRGSTFPEQFLDFAAATAEWEHTGFPGESVAGLPPVARAGNVPPDDGVTRLDHTGYRLYTVPLPAGGGPVRLAASSAGGFHGGVALVARTGNTTEVVTDHTLSDGQAAVSLPSTAGVQRLTAVVANADIALAAPKDGGDPFAPPPRYANDLAAIALRLGDGFPGEPAGAGVIDGLIDGGRIDGGGDADPIGQAIATSRALFRDGGADRVVLATADRFPDALAGAALAGNRGPILFTEGTGALDGRTQAEISRVTGGQAEVLILGGTAAVSDAAAAQARAAGGNAGCAAPLPADCRFAGAVREHTAALVAQAVWDEQGEGSRLALVARQDDFADALTAGAFAARAGVPILLTATGSAHPLTVDFLTRNDVAEVAVIGGTAAVSQAAFDGLPATDSRRRVAGSDRTGTAVAIWDLLWRPISPPAGGVVLVNVRAPNGWQSALSASVASAVFAAPQLGVETPPAALPAPTRDFLFFEVPFEFPIMAFGNTALVSDSQLAEAQAARG